MSSHIISVKMFSAKKAMNHHDSFHVSWLDFVTWLTYYFAAYYIKHDHIIMLIFAMNGVEYLIRKSKWTGLTRQATWVGQAFLQMMKTKNIFPFSYLPPHLLPTIKLFSKQTLPTWNTITTSWTPIFRVFIIIHYSYKKHFLSKGEQ